MDQERRDLWKDRSADGLVKQANQQAVRADVIGYGKSKLPHAGEQARSLDRDHAAADLVLALELGLKDLSEVKADPDLAPLLDRPDLKRATENKHPTGSTIDAR